MRTAAAVVLACVAAAVAPTQTGSQGNADARFDALATLTDARMREHGVPGVALGIVEGERVTIRGFGVTSVENPTAVTEHTVFPIASISKTFAATAAMRLVEQGKLDLRAPVRSTSVSELATPRAVGRKQLPTTVLGLLFHGAEHTQRHMGQMITTIKVVTSKER